ncbi:MAG: tetratricopeptide repeat protein [Elusimicrobiota bacterium]
MSRNEYSRWIPELARGERLVAEGRLAEAIALCDKMLKTQPDLAAALDLKGLCLLRQGRAPEAESFFRQALKHLEGSGLIHSHLGAALERLEKPQQALEAYEKAIRFEKSCAAGWFGRGRIRMFHLCDEIGSLKDLVRAVELDPKDPEIWFNLGLCRLGTQEIEAAQRDFKEALKLNPGLKDRVDKAMLDYMEAADLPEA